MATVVHIRVTLGHLRVTIGHYFSFFNSLLPVSRYIDTAFADKGSHQKKIYNQNVRTHIE